MVSQNIYSSRMHHIRWTVRMHNKQSQTHVSLIVLCYFSEPRNIASWRVHAWGGLRQNRSNESLKRLE